MKLILTQEVSGLGAAGDVVDVKSGFGRNFLVPQGLATQWTRGGEKQVTQIKRARNKRSVRDQDHALEIKAALEAAPIVISARAGSEGRLFGSITVGDIASSIRVVDVDKRKIILAAPIKNAGRHEVTVRLHADVLATVVLDVRGSKK
ncbi:MAG: 50S ribosomal protein L9 [Actinomycetes bacterium]|jgi:large subunit ribosomal protein L9|nr:50S ribosomal protein L9 [Candidatus Nanopelagicales bacterium]MDP4666708.1 50S ribosomal protein L9 [Candidatus Nanopelagicales bacterium]MDP4895868.1 50S ribosomal protein L9 [Candidatus Nanopelagicales bacterium]MDP5050383.1 50S ribosomal protein L9 [Candidatus Nanopelagicales bacterium]